MERRGGEADEDVRSPEDWSSKSEALVGGEEARGEDFWGEFDLFLEELVEEYVLLFVVREVWLASDTRWGGAVSFFAFLARGMLESLVSTSSFLLRFWAGLFNGLTGAL